MERNVIATSKGSCNSIAAILAIAVILAIAFILAIAVILAIAAILAIGGFIEKHALLCYTIRKSSI